MKQITLAKILFRRSYLQVRHFLLHREEIGPVGVLKSARAHWNYQTWAGLLHAGWLPHRRTKVAMPFAERQRPFLRARLVLAEFGGLEFGSDSCRVALKPELVVIDHENLFKLESLVGCELYPVGVWEHQETRHLFIGSDGFVYELSDRLYPLASSFERALEYFVVQYSPRVDVEKDLSKFGKNGLSWDVHGITDKAPLPS